MKPTCFYHFAFSFSFQPSLCVLQVLYQAVNYQMEPVVAKSGQEAEETDSVKVCLNLSPYVNLLMFLYDNVVSSALPMWVCLGPFVRFCVFHHCSIFDEV